MPFMKKITLLLLLFLGCYNNSFSQTFEKTFITLNNYLNGAYDMVYAPDGYLWITERIGEKIWRVDPNNTAIKDELIDLNTSVYRTGGQDGLLGFVLHPNFGKGSGTDYMYLSYTYSINGTDAGRRTRLVRLTYTKIGDDGTLGSSLTLLEGLNATNDHNSAKFAFGPDNKLY